MRALRSSRRSQAAVDDARRARSPHEGLRRPRRRSSATSTAPRDVPDGLGVPKNAPQQRASRSSTAAQVVARQAKHHLWNYGVGDEIRTLRPRRHASTIVQIARHRRRDRDLRGPLAGRDRLGRREGRRGRPARRAERLARTRRTRTTCASSCARRRAVEGECALAYVNLVGGQDELVFDGDSLVVDAEGDGARPRGAVRRPSCSSSTSTCRPPRRRCREPDTRFDGLCDQAHHHHVRAVRRRTSRSLPPVRRAPATTSRRSGRRSSLGLRDYVEKNGFRSVLFGMSGGIDSTLVRARSPSTRSAPDARLRRLQPQRLVDRALPLRRRRARPSARASTCGPSRSRRSSTRTRRRCTSTGSPRRTCRPASAPSIWMGLSNQRGPPRARLRQQVRARDRLLHDLRRRRRRLRADQGRAARPSCGSWPRWRNAYAEAQGETPPIPREHDQQAAVGRAAPRPARLRLAAAVRRCSTAILDAYVERDLGSADVVAEGFDPPARGAGRHAWSTGPSTSAASTRRAPRSRGATSAATAACRSRTAGASTSSRTEPVRPPVAARTTTGGPQRRVSSCAGARRGRGSPPGLA